MELATYELTFAADAQIDQEKIDKIADQIEKKVLDAKGKILQKDHWGKKRLAYEIRRKQYGYFVYLLFKSEGALIKSIEHELKMNESILRFLTVKLDKPALKFVERKLRKEEEEQKAKAAAEEAPEPEPVVETEEASAKTEETSAESEEASAETEETKDKSSES